MKKLLLLSVALAALGGGPALAAGPDPWAGFYFGGSVGGRWAAVDWKTLNFDSNGPASNVDNPASLDQATVRAGIFAGFNWRFAPTWLAGLEADIAWGNSSKRHTPFPGSSGIFPGFGATGHDFVGASLGWDGSIRGRLGVFVSPSWLVYVTGGVAFQQIKTSASCDGSLIGPGTSYCAIVVNESSSKTKAGWTVGVGADVMLAPNWFWRVEYRYADFGHVTNTLPPAAAAGFHANVDVVTHTALIGLAFKY